MKKSLISNPQSPISNPPWKLTAVLLLILLLLLAVGQWRSTATGAQVQVPMFYDAHYLFPRPWTQAQAAPGVPAPAPLAFYGSNTVTQPFVSGADNLTMLEIWLAGEEGTEVTAVFGNRWPVIGDRCEAGCVWSGGIVLDKGWDGGWYRLAVPKVSEAEGWQFWLMLAAPEATVENPAITRAVGGDRLGGAMRLNEYGRPGNIQLRTYVSGLAAPDAILEQTIPDLFRLRLRQYKPAPLKGELFAVLLGATAVLTILYLVLARPSGQSWGAALGWTLAGLLAGFLLWQLGDGRIRLPVITSAVPLQKEAVSLPPINDNIRVVSDMTITLWTSKREPEERFFDTAVWQNHPAILTPADSRIGYALDVPPNGRFRAGVLAEDGVIRYAVLFNGTELAGGQAQVEPVWLDVDLTPFAGQSGRLELVTEAVDGQPQGIWLQPQLLARADWLLADLPPEALPAGHRLGDGVELVGYAVEPLPENQAAVTLYWRGLRPLSEQATVFVHVLDENGQAIAQHDGQPVQNSYPLPVWPPGQIIADKHILTLPADAPLPTGLAVGLYDPVTLERWPVTNPDGSAAGDGRILLPYAEDSRRDGAEGRCFVCPGLVRAVPPLQRLFTPSPGHLVTLSSCHYEAAL